MAMFRAQVLLSAFMILSVPCGSASAALNDAASPDASAKSSVAPVVRLETNFGDILVRLDDRKAPISTANFIQYVKSGHYDGTVFHRVIKGFMIQGGGFTPDMKQKTARAAIRNEAGNGLKNQKYTIAMARTNDPHSATSQFFINTKDNGFLDFKNQSPQGWGYAVFGRVIKGQDVVDKIEAVDTGKRGLHDDVPTAPVIVKKALLVAEQPL
ncbi:MAG: peptidyl-prolyl cis-trans isomerase [Desulfovibrio sp.]|jgi:peptidyl-prolyl cis-trans isomerase B (cyclophilin B)|nr:peptidyl-prolyl cis-trans isomerase [Desulfovibrio sp.]